MFRGAAILLHQQGRPRPDDTVASVLAILGEPASEFGISDSVTVTKDTP